MNRSRMIFGLGTGRCGTRSLAKLLSLQADTHVTHEERPLLPWKKAGLTGLKQKLSRMRCRRKPSVMGDVASYYLPYVEDIIELDPDSRFVCLKRPRDEVVQSFGDWVDQVHPLPTNHWSKKPAKGWYHEPIWTRIFPQYDTADRAEGIRNYWDEYYDRAAALEGRLSEHFRIFDWLEVLNGGAGQSEMLSFCGYASGDQVLSTSIHENSRDRAPRRRQARSPSDPQDPRRCVVLVPFTGAIHPPCEDALKELERRGYPVRRVSGYAAIDQARNQLATDALIKGFEETMWIDSDIGFDPNDVDRLRAEELPIICGIYPKKGQQSLAVHTLPGTPRIVFGKQGGLVEIQYASTGFLLVRREVYETLQSELNLPVCNERFSRPVLPYFQPMVTEEESGPWYLAEDWAFCERARQCGYRIMADSKIRLWHLGTYRYGWEDAGEKLRRFDDFTLHLKGGEAEETANEIADQTVPVQPLDRREAEQIWQSPQLAKLRASFPWPNERPVDLGTSAAVGNQAMMSFVRKAVTVKTRVIAAVGGDAALSQCLAASALTGAIISLGPWALPRIGQHRLRDDPFSSDSFATFLCRCWDFRHQILPLRMAIEQGLRTLKEHQIGPDLVIVDGDREVGPVEIYLKLILTLFPRATTMGTGWHQAAVRRAVSSIAAEHGLQIESEGGSWRLWGLATGHTLIV